MEPYRKYFSSDQLAYLEESQPNFGVNILNVGHNIHPGQSKYPDPNHPNLYCFDWSKGRILEEYQLIYIAKGSGTFESEQVGSVVVHPGTVLLLFPNIWHRYKPHDDEGWEEYWVGFNGSYASYLMQQDCFDPHAPLIHMGFNSEFINVFIRLIDTLKFEGVAFAQLSSSLTTQLLGLVYASALQKEKVMDRKEQVINNIRYKIHENLSNCATLEELASQHNVSYAWFRKTFKEVVGISPGQYQLNLKLEKAARMIRETQMSISEIAFVNGFVSEHHFSKIFKKKMGVSPSAYKHQNQGSQNSNPKV